MICKNCYYKDDKEIKEVEGFDCGDRLKRTFYTTVEYCAEHDEPCEDAYLHCPYREITVEAGDLEHVKNLINELSMQSAIEQLNKIIKENK